MINLKVFSVVIIKDTIKKKELKIHHNIFHLSLMLRCFIFAIIASLLIFQVIRDQIVNVSKLMSCKQIQNCFTQLISFDKFSQMFYRFSNSSFFAA